VWNDLTSRISLLCKIPTAVPIQKNRVHFSTDRNEEEGVGKKTSI